MITSLVGQFYDSVILQVMVPDLADVSESDYEAKMLNKMGQNSSDENETRPFIICHPLTLQIKIKTWLGKDILWITEGTPVLCRKIYSEPAPVVVINGVPSETTVTTIQVGY